jgi:capsular polysaccharide biosynthesis protein
LDLGLYLQVLRRHRVILGCGIVIAVVAASLTTFNFKAVPPGMTWKVQPTYAATSTILVTQAGAPIAQTLNDVGTVSASGSRVSPFVDPKRFEYLAVLYAQLATSDRVVKSILGPTGTKSNGTLILDGGKIKGSYTASGIENPSGDGMLPFLQIVAKSSTPAAATALGRRATDALMEDIRSSQDAADVPVSKRVQLSVVQAPNTADRVKGRGLVAPLVVFVLCLFAAVALAFFLENLKSEADVETREAATPPNGKGSPPTLGKEDAQGVAEARFGRKKRRVEPEPMTAAERRLVRERVKDWGNVSTGGEGDEPSRVARRRAGSEDAGSGSTRA